MRYFLSPETVVQKLYVCDICQGAGNEAIRLFVFFH